MKTESALFLIHGNHRKQKGMLFAEQYLNGYQLNCLGKKGHAQGYKMQKLNEFTDIGLPLIKIGPDRFVARRALCDILLGEVESFGAVMPEFISFSKSGFC